MRYYPDNWLCVYVYQNRFRVSEGEPVDGHTMSAGYLRLTNYSHMIGS